MISYYNIIHDIIYQYDMIMFMISYMISYNNIPEGSIQVRSGSDAALAPPRSGSGLAATFPRFGRPDPALAETLSPDPLRLSDGHHPSAAPAVAPHPDIHLVQPATVAPMPLSRCVSAEASPSRGSFLKRCGIVGWLLPPMKHGMRGARPSTFATGQM